MGRRAKKAPVMTKRRPKLAKRFKCPFCANDDVVECNMDFRGGVGSLSCRLCGAAYQMPIHHLHEPVDVFSEWLDDCEAAANPSNTNNNNNDRAGRQDEDDTGGGGVPRYEDEDDEDDNDDDDLPSSGLARKPTARENNSKSQTTSKSGGKTAPQRATYTDLGLDDSDSDDDDD